MSTEDFLEEHGLTSGDISKHIDGKDIPTDGTEIDLSDDGDEKKGKKEKKGDAKKPSATPKSGKDDITKLAFWTNWEGWLEATPVLGKAYVAGNDLKNGDYINAVLNEEVQFLNCLR
ncbi:hypothetical protein [Mucilaginibacter sp. 44-25]|uniref:hypothetical protein n=1 Tax=Mucilaginibacter sp. 44-25 TaxID=1895794 RepID=UPI00095ED226|nr:hypothetical protein [Mucilaginibacter sp. 44-25]OJW17969.1 MAG: hypothetical protein BGO48_15415 [Mucilaginibacter sp. 44-25]